MTARTRAALKALFTTESVPIGNDYGDLIDSAANLQDTTTQVFLGPIQAPSLAVGTLSAVSVITDSLTVTNLVASTVSAQLVQASAVRHKNPHALVYGATPNTYTVAAVSAYHFLSAALSSSPDGMLGFSANGVNRITYTGVTAAMLVSYNLSLSHASAATVAQTIVSKNNLTLPESRCTFTIVSGSFNAAAGAAVVDMGPNDYIEMALKISAASTPIVSIGSYVVSIVPVSFKGVGF